MTNLPSQYTDAQQQLYKNQKRHRKDSKFKHRGALHLLIGVACFGFLMANFDSLEQAIGTQFGVFTADKTETSLYYIPRTVNLKQKHGDSVYDIAGNTVKKDEEAIRVNRANKRDSTYFVKKPQFTDEQKIQIAARRTKQIAELDRQAAIHDAEMKKLQAEALKNATSSEIKPKNIVALVADKPLDVATTQGKKTSIVAQPNAKDLLANQANVPKILTGLEIDKLKQDIKNQAEVYVAEQSAPMPTIHSAKDKSQAVDAILANVTARARDTQLGWSAGNGKSTTIRRQTISLDKLNGFTVIDGKIATKESEIVADKILMANVKVPAPLKRPKYIPRPKAKVISTSRTSLTCLTTALYHEVRGESRAGQLAVAEVISSRRRSKSYPNTFCGVIYQNATKRNACQFSFACDGKTDLPRDLKTWQKMKNLAGDFLAGRASSPAVRGATHYHTKAVSPKWRWSMKRLGSIGAHIFYKDPRAKA